MAEAQGTPPAAVKGGVVAYLSLDGAIKAGELYKKAFGAEQVHLHPADSKGRTMHLHLIINGSSVMLSDAFPEHGHPYVPAAGFSLMLPVKDVDSWWQRAVDAGLAPTHEAGRHVLGRPLCPGQGFVRRVVGVRWAEEGLSLHAPSGHALMHS